MCTSVHIPDKPDMAGASNMSQSQSTLGRRQVVAGAGTAGALAAAAVALKPTIPHTPAPQPTAEPKPDEGGGYRVTEHVMRYYQTAKV
jgi:hypothetical protein